MPHSDTVPRATTQTRMRLGRKLQRRLVDNSHPRAVQFPVARGPGDRRHPARAGRRGSDRADHGAPRGVGTMTAGIRLRYTPDLAGAIDAAGLAAYGIDAAPAPL